MFTHTKSTRMSVGKAATLFGILWLILTLSLTVRAQRVCVGGVNAGKECKGDGDCTGGMCAGFTPAPDRGVNFSTNCPPNQNGVKAPPGDARDKDVNDDGTDDYFMGEWKFVEGNKDLIVRRWCINRPMVAGHFDDFFSFEVITSLNGVETNDPTKKVDPTAPV